MNEYLFSYGTLQEEPVQVSLFGRVLPGTPDTLPGYKVAAIEITDKAFLANGGKKEQRIVAPSMDQNDKVKGTVLELTAAELSLADTYEPEDYKRVKVTLGSGKEAWVYAAV